MVLGVGVYTGADGWHAGAQLPVTAHAPEMLLLDDGALIRLGGFARTESGQWTPISVEGGAANPQQPLDARFGDAIQLVGVSAPTTARHGEPLRFTMFWQSMISHLRTVRN